MNTRWPESGTLQWLLQELPRTDMCYWAHDILWCFPAFADMQEWKRRVAIMIEEKRRAGELV
jgi:hypothetical protein